ncbi:hypothetical protein JVU11DRAFT_3312 [Chiua virens]|nr:hypothetical protein JVU11DRAFT_3312 [Chiua virens]
MANGYGVEQHYCVPFSRFAVLCLTGRRCTLMRLPLFPTNVAALCEELESTRNPQMLRVHFTPSVFRAFADYALIRAGGSRLPRGFNRVYWIVIGGESLHERDLELATMIFPSATIACSYACSEAGFAGISQVVVRSTDPIPSTISFGPSQGCTDLVLLDDSLSVIPRNEEGATGVIGLITSQSATHYLENQEASQHMFRPWGGNDILLYTDDIGCMQADGTIAIRGRSSRDVKVNGLFVDLDYVERALAPAFADNSLDITGFKLVKSNATDEIALFVSSQVVDPMLILKHACDHLRVSGNEEFASVIGSLYCIPEMPFNASYKIDLAELQRIVDSAEIIPDYSADFLETAPLSKVDALAQKIATEVEKLSNSPDVFSTDMPLLYSGLTPITMVRLHFWLQSEHEYTEQLQHLFDEGVTAQVVASEILGDEKEVMDDTDTIPTSPISQATMVDDEDLDSEEGSDYPHKNVPATWEIAEKEREVPFPPPVYSSRPKSTLIVMHPPVETIPETINHIPTHPTLHYTPYSFIFVSWLTPLLRLGSKRPLLESDLLPLRRNDEAIVVERWIDPFWTQLRQWFFDRQHERPGLFQVIFVATRRLWMISGILWFLSVLSSVLSPLVLQQIIVAANAPPPPTGNATELVAWTSAIEEETGGFPLIFYNTYILASILLVLKLIYTFCGRSADQLVKRMALDVKTSLISAVYKKSLRLSTENNHKYGKGYIMNLVNVDCETVSKSWEQIHQAWSVPVQLITVAILLSRLLGVAAWASVGVLLFALLLLIMVVPLFMRKAAPWFMRLGDRRLKTIREVLDGIRVVKINGREKHFLTMLESIRTEQLGWLRKFNTGVTIFVIVGQISNTAMPLAAFSLFGHENMGLIPASRVFPALSFFGMLVDPLIALPQLLSAVVIAVTSWARIYSFLLAEEKSSTSWTPSSSVMSIGSAITIVDGAFSWTALENKEIPVRQEEDDAAEVSSIDKVEEDVASISGPSPFLHNLNVSIRAGSLTAIVGSVGSGKSSLLSAIIGEMIRVSGEVHYNGSIAYCAQQPWIQTSTIQDNILFGRRLDMHQLQKAIQTTVGMATQMSEKGNNLSGGQKSRLALARAVYSDADIYLFDDVLAALDARVGRTVFRDCIRHALAGKTRVLVTHQLQYLSQVDHIIVVSDGAIVEQGSFDDLVSRNGELTRLLSEVQASMDGSKNTKDEKRKSVAVPKKTLVKQEETVDRVIVEEERNTGAVDAATWWAYLKATGGVWMIVVLLLEVLLLQGSAIILSQWLTWWTEDAFHEKAAGWIGIYDAIGFAVVLITIVINTTILMSTVRASRVFHLKALQGVLYAPIWWFESQPIGRVMNRFSKDIEAIDQRLMPQLFPLVAGIGNLISTIIILGYSTPIMLAFVFPMLVLYCFVLRFYRKSLRELKRLESIGRGPLQSRINETLDGIPTIMAYGREADFENAVGTLLDASNKPTFLRAHAEIWVTLRMEIMSSSIVVALSMLAHTKVVGNSTQFSLALTYASALTYIMNLLLKSTASVEAEMNSVERLMSYTESLPQEDPAYLGSDPAEGVWPSRGEIVLRDVDAAYHSRPDKLVLRNVNLTFSAGETVFIVGRTGSGKSTLLSLLLRMVESSNGTVEIDGRDTKSLGVTTLRRGMQVIPQDPFIFSGTIRSCLDFNRQYHDEALWHALELVGLKNFVASQDCKLDTAVENNGSNYSVGQRQLLCLASAILCNPKILLLDEATASIDAGADVFIQQAMRRSCPDATILSVMHRLSDRILEECDKVLVMEQGVPIEYAPPRELLARPTSMLSKLMAAARNGN